MKNEWDGDVMTLKFIQTGNYMLSLLFQFLKLLFIWLNPLLPVISSTRIFTLKKTLFMGYKRSWTQKTLSFLVIIRDGRCNFYGQTYKIQWETKRGQLTFHSIFSEGKKYASRYVFLRYIF